MTGNLPAAARRPTGLDRAEVPGLAQGRVSSHLSCLRWCGYVEARVEGRFNRYHLVDERVREIRHPGAP